jgi:hypothetical protein
MERRSVPRIKPDQPLSAKVRAYVTARVLDISHRGIQVEMPSALPPRATCDLRFQVNGEEILLRATVRRCVLWGQGAGDKDQRVLLYRAGLQFDEASRAHVSALEALLPGLAGTQASPSEGGETGEGGPSVKVAVRHPEES